VPEELRGVQIGVVNKAYRLKGFQIGLVNIDAERKKWFPLLRVRL